MMPPQDAITLSQAIVLGVIQGLTEFLPISSSAHLKIIPALIGWPDVGAAYSAVLQLGSSVAVIAYFFRALLQIAVGSVQALKTKDYGSQDFRLAACIILGTAPICVIGLLVKKLLEQADSPLRFDWVIGTASIIMAILLMVAEIVAKPKRKMSEIGVRDGVLVGLGQCLALIPGCSRSGSTLTVALLLGLNRSDAARFSFLLGVPAVLISGLVELKEVFKVSFQQSDLVNLAFGLIASTVVSYLSIAWLIKYLQTHSTWIFVIYRIIFGTVVLGLSFGVVHPFVVGR